MVVITRKILLIMVIILIMSMGKKILTIVIILIVVMRVKILMVIILIMRMKILIMVTKTLIMVMKKKFLAGVLLITMKLVILHTIIQKVHHITFILILMNQRTIHHSVTTKNHIILNTIPVRLVLHYIIIPL